MDKYKFHELEESSKNGDPDSLYKLACLYYNGKSYGTFIIPTDRVKAKQLLETAAKKSHKPSIKILYKLYKLNVIDLAFNNVWSVFEKIQNIKYKLVKDVNEFVNQAMGYILMAGLIVFFLLLVLAVIYFGLKGIAAIPVSVSIIIGAVIIAFAIYISRH